jgi:hypothetical protein
MGFDPRRWQPSTHGNRVTSNLDTLLAENDALRREVRRLQQRLDALSQTHRHTDGPSHGLTASQVEHWGVAMARHPHWEQLRISSPGGLRDLVDDLRRQGWNPTLSLEQELNRRSPGLGTELEAALRGPHSRVRWAVRAAFALYGPRAPEWLSETPLRVVEELRRRLEQRSRRRGTRTENHTHAGQQGRRRGGTRTTGGGSVDARTAALHLLGLEPGATAVAIKKAYRRLAKDHHPDLGGRAEAFHRLEAAYRLLTR